jgi:hypothetical protein
MIAPRKLQGIVLKPRVKILQRKRADPTPSQTRQEQFDILRKIVEEHRQLIDHLADS